MLPTDIPKHTSLVLTEDIVAALDMIRRSSTEDSIPSRSAVARTLLAYALGVVFADDDESDTIPEDTEH